MDILLDAIPLKGLMTGISRYVRNLYGELERMPGVTVQYFDGYACGTAMPAQAQPGGAWSRATSLVWKLPDTAAFAFRAAKWMSFEMKVRRRIRRNDFSVYHETAFTPAAVGRIPQVVTIYDLSLSKYREMHPKERVWFWDFFMKRRLSYAAHVITISEFIRSEICEEMGLSPERVTAVPLAADPLFRPRNREDAHCVVRDMGLPEDYFLFVGTLEPRKNLPLLIRGAALCANDIPIVLTGWEGWSRKALDSVMNDPSFKRKIFITGYVDEESLACLYSNAIALVFPSFYEGFGLPVLEAMACGCPVICSRAASLPEVAGDAAILIDPEDAEGLAKAMDRIAENGGLRNELIRKGLERSSQFTWNRTARETLAVFRSVVGMGGAK